MDKRILTQKEISQQASEIAQYIVVHEGYTSSVNLFGIPRGGIPAAYAVQYALSKDYSVNSDIVDDAEDAHFIIDDLIDSGTTSKAYISEYPDTPFLTLFTKQPGDDWIVFPWEETDEGSAEDIPIRLLQYIGEDIERGGLKETPKRVLKAWDFWTQGYKQDPKDILKVFDDGAEKYDQMVLIRDIPIYSHCEHHLAPFFGVVHVGYIPDGRIVGLSKLSRLVDVFARRLQVQERLTEQIAASLEKHLKPKGVGIVIECRHMCMESRGIQRQGAVTTTSSMKGVLLEKQAAREEFMSLISSQKVKL